MKNNIKTLKKDFKKVFNDIYTDIMTNSNRFWNLQPSRLVAYLKLHEDIIMRLVEEGFERELQEEIEQHQIWLKNTRRDGRFEKLRLKTRIRMYKEFLG